MRRAIKERGLKVHSFVYDKEKNSNVRLIENETEGGAKVAN